MVVVKIIVAIVLAVLYALLAIANYSSFERLKKKKCTTAILLYIAKRVMLMFLVLEALLFTVTLKVLML